MSDIEQYKKDLAREFSAIEDIDATLAEDVVNAGPTMQYINKCIADNVCAKDAAVGLQQFQIDYMKKLVNNETDVEVITY